MGINKIRNSMAFVEEYGTIDNKFILRVYQTKNRGMYGYQYCAILWDTNDKIYISEKTTGCGYNKIDHCVENVCRKKNPNLRYYNEYQILSEMYGIDSTQIYHAHS